MVDLDFERRINPWLFDSSGNLTEAAKKQFPDLAAAASGAAAPGFTPTTPVSGGPVATVTVSPEALRRAATNTDTLKTKFGQACKQPSAHASAASEQLPTSWALRAAITNANSVWTDQVKALEDAIGNVAGNLRINADRYAQADHANAQNFGKS
ncbi:WXG100 family type VII secretion target [Kitasatospora aureofaciens]|uniref:WXG100 family type VII secretion target n=1 Tax=Kitasatospora aureofaciens TaxID=1894 RepID=UPI001C478085|nr:type VII secretion target [Kitasatospora aureofaciens]MBV6698708.1 ESX-1 secretion-associated protein [Kitasatospora aureofaciens]